MSAALAHDDDSGAPALWPHQREAIDLALSTRTTVHGREGLLLEVGMSGGKSRAAIEIADRVAAMRVLVLCPKNVAGVWPRELAEHSRRDWRTWSGQAQGARGALKNPTVAQRAAALIGADTDAIKLGAPLMVAVNYEAAWQGQMANATIGVHWDLIILDESHRAKAPRGKASSHARAICDKARARGALVLLLTGTSAPNSGLDLWAQIRCLDGGNALGTNYHHFTRRYGLRETIRVAGGQVREVYKRIDPERSGALAAAIDHLVYRVDQQSVDRIVGLPPARDEIRDVQLTAPTRAAYDRMERDLVAELDGATITAANAMVLTTRLAQLSGGHSKDIDGHVRHVLDVPEKATALEQLLAQRIPPADSVVVFCRFHADLDAVRDAAQRAGRTYGELSGRRRDGLTDDSRMADVQVLGCQIKSGGVGIDLTRARWGVFYSLPFELADVEQARKRLHRKGQTQQVVFLWLLAHNTIDRAIYGALRKKRDAIADVLNRLTGYQETHR